MTEKEKREAEQLKERTDIRQALSQTAGGKEAVAGQHQPPPRPVKTKRKIRIGIYLLLLVGLAALYYLLRLREFDLAIRYLPSLQRATLGAMAIVLVLAVSALLDAYLINPLEDIVLRFNLRRILRLITVLVLAFIVISILFANWYTAVVSLGIISLILGFALQTPITSFIGWIYILVRAPYRVGDRIKIGDAAGDVIDVSYLDTTLWEFGGDYLSTDHPSGRLIKFPNSNVLTTHVYNYSWPLFPYIWNEITFNIAYDSDLEFVATTMREAAEEEVGPEMRERVRVYRELLAETPVDHLEVREHPAVNFRISANTWIDASVRYLVDPKEAGRVKTRLIRTMLERLNAEPDRVLFPKSNLR
jgi:small-conductance mechanosensitive channel